MAQQEHIHHKSYLVRIYGNICQKCKKEFQKSALTVDHIIPKSQGGTNDLSNKQLLCVKCHRKKTMIDHQARNAIPIEE